MQSSSPHAPRRSAAGFRTGLLGLCLAAALAAAPVHAGSDGVVNVNTASVDELVRLPGIGEAKAQAIVEFRKERGAFKTVDQLGEVKGIGDAALERIRPHVAIDGKTTLN